MHDKPRYDHLSSGREAETRALDRFLDACDRYNVPISFDVVGHLFHDSCSDDHEGPHQKDWFDEDPGSDIKSDPIFYAPDLTARIRQSLVQHEICTHTYSHLLCDETAPEVVQWELRRVEEIHESEGLPKPRSIVFPRHLEPPLSVLEPTAIEVVRRPVESAGPPNSFPPAKYHWILFRTHPATELYRDGDILVTPCTPYPSLTSQALPQGTQRVHPAFRVLPTAVRRKLHRRYLHNAIDTAIREDAHVHLWTHLHNMANNHQLSVIERAFEYLATRQRRGDVVVRPMCELVKSIDGPPRSD
ncbi:polysaccharide deacetylase family protein [Halorussus ruber]|uniref:polysaccharide deacetylase family protein n=1 Tax=Halorussus ruber TaxID=1126238 RepID=UPI0034A3E322